MFPGQDLLFILDELRQSIPKDSSIPLQALKYRLDISGVERTVGLMKSLGDDCSYYRKSLDIFLKRDYNDIYKILVGISAAGEGDEQTEKAKQIMEGLGVEG